jgi:hypothetical protein
VLVPLFVFVEGLVGRRLLAPGDGSSYYIPLRIVTARAWRSGSVPAWDPWAFAGSPLLSLHQSAVFYPPNLATLVLPVTTAHNLVVAGSFAVGGGGAYLLCRRLHGDHVGAAVAGVGFGLSGFLFGHVVHTSIVASAVWLPWALWGFELLRERVNPGHLVAASGPVAMAVLAGHSQMVAVILAAVAVYAASVTVLDRPRAWPSIPLAALAAVTGLALGAVQLLPVLAVIGDSGRADFSYGEAMAFSFAPSSTPLLLFPYLFGNQLASGPFTALYRGEWTLTELSGSVGAAALVLAGAGLGLDAMRRDRRRAALIVVAVVALLVALGDSTPIGRVVHALPVYGQFRSWGRATVVVDLVVAVLAGLGTSELRAADAARRRRAGRRASIVGGGVVVIGLLTLILPTVDARRAAGTAGWLALALPVTAAVVAAIVAIGARRRRLVTLALVPVVVADLLAFGLFFRWRDHSPDPDELAALLSPEDAPGWGTVPDAPGGVDRMAYVGGDPLQLAPWYQRVLDAKQVRSVNGFDPLAPARYREAVGAMDDRGGMQAPELVWSAESHVLDLLRVSLVVAHPPSTDGTPPAELGEGRPVPGTDLVRYERTPNLPQAFLVGEARPVNRDQARRALWGRDELDPSATALVEGGCEGCWAADRAGPAGTVRSGSLGTDSARFEVETTRPAVLVVSQAWAPGWSASVDGDQAPVVLVDGLVQGVPVGPGSHVVALRYRPPGLGSGIAASGATILAIAGWALIRRYRHSSVQMRQSRSSRGASTAA